LRRIQKPEWTKKISVIKGISPKIEVMDMSGCPCKYEPKIMVLNVKELEKLFKEK
jgi:hypothetical protein